jgi:hypothetical protein
MTGIPQDRGAAIASEFPSLNGHGGAAGEATKPRGRRQVLLTPAPTKVRPVRWLWHERLPLGALTLLAGREGIGKSTAAYTLIAQVTRGTLPGRYFGQPKAVVVCATEDSWEHTISPRLMAAGADMGRVYRVDVVTSEGADGTLSLPGDLPALADEMREADAALLLLDPLLSRLDAALDTHKDAEVRQALEPLVAFADRSGCAVLALIHVNKARTDDPLSSIMGSRAFAAVARCVMYVVTDSADPDVRLLGTPKNNLGRSNGPSLRFSIESAVVAHTDEGPVTAGRLRWDGEDSRTVGDVLAASQDTAEVRAIRDEARDWLHDYLVSEGGAAQAGDVKRAGKVAGYSDNAVRAARMALHVEVVNLPVVPRRTLWQLPGTQAEKGGRS